MELSVDKQDVGGEATSRNAECLGETEKVTSTQGDFGGKEVVGQISNLEEEGVVESCGRWMLVKRGRKKKGVKSHVPKVK